MKKFWILWHPQGQTPPTVKFATFQEAKNCAENMIGKIGIGTMYVMEAVAGVEPVRKVRWTTAKKD